MFSYNSGKNQFANILDNLNIKYYILPFARDYGSIDSCTEERANESYVEDYKMSIELSKILKNEQVDIVHINSSTSNVGAIAALMAGIPYIWHVRELLQEHYNCTFYDEKLEKELFSKADKIISISDCVKKSYKQKYGLETLRMYNGLNISKYKRKLDNKKYNKSFLLAGVIDESKGQWDAIRAVEKILEQGYSDIELYIVGDGDENLKWILKKYILQKKMNSNIHVIDFQNDLADFREKVSYSITGSKMEALGRATIEAMLAGNVVIGSNTGGTAEIIGTNQERGYLYQQGNYIELAKVMINVIEEDDNKKNQIVVSAQKYAEENFDSVKYCDKLYLLYKEIVKTRKQGNKVYIDSLDEKYKKLCLQVKTNNNEKFEDEQTKKEQLISTWNKKWIQIERANLSFAGYFSNKNIHTVAIYGMGLFGQKVYDALENSSIMVKYVMDRNNKKISRIVQMVNPDLQLPKVDAIIVTVLLQESELVKWLKRKCNYRIVGLSEILNEITDTL